MPGTANFEGTDRLQAFGLAPDSLAANHHLQQRGFGQKEGQFGGGAANSFWCRRAQMLCCHASNLYGALRFRKGDAR